VFARRETERDGSYDSGSDYGPRRRSHAVSLRLLDQEFEVAQVDAELVGQPKGG
jgi:hypothetical protein